jgi:diaminopimelate decarboxylase
MDEFQYGDDGLGCEQVSLASVAEAVGTPTYVYSQKMLGESVRRFDDAFSDVPHLVCYGIKANSNLTILRRLVEWGIGFDAVSGGELFRAVQAGAAHEKIILSGVGKTRDEIRYALNTGILFISVESRSEIEMIAEVAKETGRTARVVLRTNPDVDAETHPYISTGLKSHKFGISFGEAASLAIDAQSMPGIEVAGIGCHIGSQITSLGPFEEAASSIVGMAADLLGQGLPLEFLDFGGGLGISYEGEVPPTPRAYAETLIGSSKDLGLTLILEPGRVIVGTAGILLCRVIRKKTQGDKRFVIVDAGMNDLIRPPLYDAFHSLSPVRKSEETEVIDLVGPICESADFLARDRRVSSMEPGDLVAVMTAGAYGAALASNYNSRPRAAEVLVDGDTFSVIRRRESYEDLIRLEK